MRVNSRIAILKGQCLDCPKGTTRALRAGRCVYHYKLYRASINDSNVRKSAVTLHNSKGITHVIRDRELDNWYKEIRMRECLPGGYLHGVGFVAAGAPCMECGLWISGTDFKSATAHILPKREGQFPSIATHPLNYGILGPRCGCHQRWDCSWDDAVKMKVFPLLKFKFLQFKDQIAPEEINRIPYVFTTTL